MNDEKRPDECETAPPVSEDTAADTATADDGSVPADGDSSDTPPTDTAEPVADEAASPESAEETPASDPAPEGG